MINIKIKAVDVDRCFVIDSTVSNTSAAELLMCPLFDDEYHWCKVFDESTYCGKRCQECLDSDDGLEE